MTWVEIALCTVAAAFFAGIETGLIAADQFVLFSKQKQGVLYAKAASFLLQKPERMLSTTLVGTNIAVVTGAVLLSSHLRTTPFEHLAWVASILLTIVMLILSEIVPKTFLRQHADTVAVRLAPILLFFFYVFLPISTILNVVVLGLLLLTGQFKPSKQHPRTKDDLRMLVKLSNREAGIPQPEQRIIEEIFDFQETMAREVMVHMHQAPTARLGGNLRQLLDLAVTSKLRYIPVYENRIDNIVGYVDIEDVLVGPRATISDMMRPPVFYPETKRIPDLLFEMNQKRLGVVFLVSEHGRVTGMVTPREIVSEIIGFVPGAEAQRNDEIEREGPGSFLVPAQADIEDFQNVTGIRLEKGAYDTVGGYLMDRIGRIPEPGTSYRGRGAVFTVTKATARTIDAIRVVRER
jgi:CBS domain containing-hemolysin-like protein